ncbi:type II toxin-antitoxin system RelE/ParE family toxin [Iningainema tapete]|uniref:Toxin n=1 Tax=Iningainema tapete BLCC-T55 TaxID=2748662 RepID=A0A8J6XNI5_9CYAN|nr:type II toxin-antitoxin system RelE/ParE family toxin [Iningainema tapete]MBD2776276.1 type II toxin-antitoxin system RelE/ParE family toxin [Iningainema tapete BLCC-T55]
MSRRCELTELADQDIFEVSVYVAQNLGVAAAQRFIDTINEKFQLLANSPGLGRSRLDLAPELRSFPVGKYIIFYRPISEGILVVRVLHGARDITSIFEAEQDS